MLPNQPRRSNDPFKDHVIANPSLQPITYTDAHEQTGGALLPVSASELIDKTFVIYRAKPFNSTFENGGVAYFCTIRIGDEEDYKTVVIGGKACVDFLHTYARAGFTQPLQVTLKMTNPEAGKAQYYYFA